MNRHLTYEAWRITFQDSEQAARAAFKTAQDEWDKRISAEAELTDTSFRLEAVQAKLDAVMLEYCPEDMSKEQFDNWAKNQVVSQLGEEELAKSNAKVQELESTPEPIKTNSIFQVGLQYAYDPGDGGRPILAFLIPSEFPDFFRTYDEAHAFLKTPPGFPLGWVVREIKVPNLSPGWRGPIQDGEMLAAFSALARENREKGTPGDPGFKAGIRFAEQVHGIK